MFSVDDTFPENRLYKCDKILAEWLIFSQKIPLFAIKEELYVFIITDNLKNSLKIVPENLKLNRKELA